MSTFGSIGQPNNDGEFGSIVAIDTDSAGNVYVLDTEGSGRVKKFSSAGVYISRYNFPTWSCTPNPGNNYNCSRPPGYPSLGSGFSSNQTGFAVVPAGDAFIVRDSLNRVMKFDMSSGYVSGSERSVSNSWGWNPSAGGSNVVLNADGTAFTA
ncbi:MAG: hypothetical protein KGR19_10975, partial [Acidobacteria bacterium]|nr:hypothetical protein [Acidobacteriota bacterium]